MPDAPAASPAPASAAPAQTAAVATTASTPPATAPAATTTPTTTPTQTAPAATATSAATTAPAAPGTEVKPVEKTAEPAKVDDAQPAPFDLKLPKDAAIDAATATELSAMAQKAGVNAEQAQAIAAFMNGKAAAFLTQVQQAQAKAHEDQVTAWDSSLKADKEIGGEKIQANMDLGRRALERFASKEAIEFLRESGLNSHPELARIFVRIGKAMGEDRIATGNGAGGKSSEQLLAERYPSMQKSA